MKTCKVAALAASISLALAGTAAFAAPPAANQLPGQGKVALGSVTGVSAGGTAAAPTMGIALGGNTVIAWGDGGTDINKLGAPGFNIGSAAEVDFTGTYGVLNVDVSGDPSQIYGALTGQGNVYVANGNGIIVGPHASIVATGAVGLIANNLIGSTVAGFDGTVGSGATGTAYDGAGGDVTVMAGGALSGASVLVSGGGMVNVDLTGVQAGATLAAGVPSANVQVPHPNTGASLVVSGDGEASFQSAGNAASSGTVLADNGTTVAGQFTNTGTMTLEGGFDSAGELVNQSGTLTAGGAVSVGSFSNSGLYTGNGYDLTTTAGGLTNTGQMADVGDITVTAGDLINAGQIGDADTPVASITVDGGGLTNQGAITANGNVDTHGGDVGNQGSVTANEVNSYNGSIVNDGTMTVSQWVNSWSDTTVPSFTDGADYSVTNNGTIIGTGDLFIYANDNTSRDGDDAANHSTGSFTNNGIIQPGASGSAPQLHLLAWNDILLGGKVQFTNGHPASLSPASPDGPLSYVELESDGDAGLVTVGVPLASAGNVDLTGNQVAVRADVAAADDVEIDAGDKPASYTGSDPATDYAVRIASGVTVAAGDEIHIDGTGAGDGPNVILQGTLAGDLIFQGSDFYSGPAGSIQAPDWVIMHFTGKVKTAPYLNDPNNFRYNFLPIVSTHTGPGMLYLGLSPVAYTTNGTDNDLSAVNILVDGDVSVYNDADITTPVINGSGTAVTGVVNVPDTHLVLQSTGNIQVSGGVETFYWPGLVYLGTIGATPGSLGLGTITLDGNFSNVLPGNVGGKDGVHFATQLPLDTNGHILTTNANAWFNFGTDTLTDLYTAHQGATGPFYSGAQGPGAVVNYAPTPASGFHTQAPNPTK